MHIAIRKETNALVVSVIGRMDAVTAPEFDKSINELIACGERAFLVNLSGLEYISSAGLRSILAFAKRLKEQDGKLLFSGLQGHVREVFSISGFLGIFKVYDSDVEALKDI
ncbi:MAG: STAS domain-containing protein [Desulfobacteraceae bacterium]|nr:STAS domain-containing protein [Desulfobacteraceae bacterium]